MVNPRLAVLISGNGSNLQSIIDHIEEDRLDAELVCVVSNNANAYGLERVSAHHIPGFCIDHRNYANKAEFEKALLDQLSPYRPDLIILAGFMRILSESFVTHYSGRILNIHPSLLPKYKGLDTHTRVLDSGDVRHGATVHVVTPELDSGTIIIQRDFAVEAGDSIESLQQKVHKIEHEIYPLAISTYAGAGYKPEAFSPI